MRQFFASMTRDPISLLGAAITTASALLIACLFTIELFGFLGNPYIGILAYLILPAFFVMGLILIPIGVRRARKRARRAQDRGEVPTEFAVIDLNLPRVRHWVLIFVALSVVNLVILATVTFKGVEVMETTEFCGATCHSVMAPEFTAYQRSPHARVPCVDCHIGPGADWFVKSKLTGAWQVVAVTFDLYPRPIPTPIHDLRPSRETCEQCHWPTKFVGDRLKVLHHTNDDEANTPLSTVLLMRVGGPQGGSSRGIHWHVDPEIDIRYRSDASRETIYEVELTRADGTRATYYPDGDPEAGPGEGLWRQMDCVDCHNRPAHAYRLPEEEVDAAFQQQLLARDLPFLRREAVRILSAEYPSHEEARSGISTELSRFYDAEYPELAATRRGGIAEAGRVLGDLYALNVFPEMKVTWGTYPDHIGHEQSAGCFRCHDDLHATTDGDTIAQDCFECHSLLAIEEEAPEILSTLDL